VPRLLLVEDNPLLLRLYQALLEEGGHQVRAAACAAEAISALGVEAPDVLVMDLRIPELTVCACYALWHARLASLSSQAGLPILPSAASDPAWTVSSRSRFVSRPGLPKVRECAHS
jgi:CheY-like chemotaxis protein